MERVKVKLQNSVRALQTLDEILQEPYSVIVRDATIQRFEYTFEALWKFVKEFLKIKEGIISNSPKSCFRDIAQFGYLTEEETVRFLEMTDRRNETSHTYKEEVSRIIFEEIPSFVNLMTNILEKMKEKVCSDVR